MVCGFIASGNNMAKGACTKAEAALDWILTAKQKLKNSEAMSRMPDVKANYGCTENGFMPWAEED